MFIDEVVMEVEAGRGGDGCMAFLREKFVPMGGPNGGNGGKGADIIFKADEGLRTLLDLRYQKKIKGEPGQNGEGKNKNGSYAEDKIIKVPVGTTIKDYDTGMIIADLTKHNEEVIVAYGGKGGRGNVTLATRNNPCPSFAERGEPGENRKIKVELRMLADVGLVGLPSVGKSTLLSMITNANPKIAAYHFTTLSPNLGVVSTKDNNYVIADLPGLIEGASLGEGLGDKFLKHIERTRVIVHVVDMSGSEGRDPYEDYLLINKELEAFNKDLLKKPMIVLANKMDLAGAKENLQEFRKKVNCEIYEVSGALNKGLDVVVNRLADILDTIPYNPLYDESQVESHILYKFKKEEPFTITRDDDGTWVVSGKEVEKIFKMTKFTSDEAIKRFAKRLRRMGIDDKLIKMGAKTGDSVRILDFYFDFTE